MTLMTKTDRAAEALLVAYGVIFWSLVGEAGIAALAGAVLGAVGIWLNGGWKEWSAFMRMAGIYIQLLVIWGMIVESFGRPEFAAYLTISAIGVIALRRAARHAIDYKRSEWKPSH